MSRQKHRFPFGGDLLDASSFGFVITRISALITVLLVTDAFFFKGRSQAECLRNVIPEFWLMNFKMLLKYEEIVHVQKRTLEVDQRGSLNWLNIWFNKFCLQNI